MQNKSFAEMRKITGINQISQLCNHAASMVGSDAQKNVFSGRTTKLLGSFEPPSIYYTKLITIFYQRKKNLIKNKKK